jgi:hypothetical protein
MGTRVADVEPDTDATFCARNGDETQIAIVANDRSQHFMINTFARNCTLSGCVANVGYWGWFLSRNCKTMCR